MTCRSVGRFVLALVAWLLSAPVVVAQTVHADLQAYFVARMQPYATRTTFSFAAGADVHVASGWTTKNQWKAIVSGWRDSGHLFGAIGGDIGFGAAADISNTVTGVSEVVNPPLMLYAMGNHELDGPSGKRAWIDALYPGAVQPSSWTPTSSLAGNSDRAYWSFDIGISHFVVLDANTVVTDASRDGAGVLGTEQLSWLAADLSVNLDKNVFVFVHEPIDQALYSTPYYTLNDRAVLIDILEVHPKQVFLFSGHLHDYRGITKWKGLTAVHVSSGDYGPDFGVGVWVNGDAVSITWSGITDADTVYYDQHPMYQVESNGGISALKVGEEGGDYGRTREKQMQVVSAENGATPTAGSLMLKAGPITWYDPLFVSEQLIKIVPGMTLSYDIQLQNVRGGLDAVALQPNWVMLDGSQPPAVWDQNGISLSVRPRDGSFYLYNEDLPLLSGQATGGWYHRVFDLTSLAGNYLDGFYLASAAMAVNVDRVYVDNIRVEWPASGCSMALTPSGASFTSFASSGTVSVDASPGCAWTATAGANWFRITSGVNGIGFGNVAYFVDPNPSASPRSGTVTIGGQIFTVTQAGLLDTIAPETTITQAPAAVTGMTVTVAFTSSESGSSFSCSLDGGSAFFCTSPWTSLALSAGVHMFSVYGSDAAGNTDPTPATCSWTVDTTQPPPPPAGKTVLVLAPHPDDEALIAAGVIQQAVARGDRVVVAVVANGDVGGPASGLVREGESVAAMQLLGLSEPDLIFFGYGDALLIDLYQSTSPSAVFTSYAGRRATYGTRGLGSMDYHSYLTGVPGPYSRGTIVGDFKALLTNVRPDDVYTTSYMDSHLDHQATVLFLFETIAALRREGVDVAPRVHMGVVHAPCDTCSWPDTVFTPTVPYQAQGWMDSTPFPWSQVESVPVPASMQVTDVAQNLKHRVLEQYQTEGTGVFSNWLYAFVKKNEVFWITDTRANIAGMATVTASADTPAYGQVAANVADNIIDGPRGEWVAEGDPGNVWVRMSWSAPVRVSQVVLHDRLGAGRVQAGTLLFSDGSSLAVGSLTDNGAGCVVPLTPRTIAWMQFRIDQFIGTLTGLAEFEVFGVPASSTTNTAPYFINAPLAAPDAIPAGGTSTITASAYDVDGDPLTYTWSVDQGTITDSGPSAVFTAPAISTQAVSAITVTADDGRGGSVTNTTFVAGGAAAVAVSSLAISPTSVGGGATAQGTVTLSGSAPGNLVVTLTSGTPAAATVPATVTVGKGASSATFTVQTIAVAASTAVTIAAAGGGGTAQAILTVTPARVTSVALAPASIVGGAASTGTVTLSGVAGTAVEVALTCTNIAAATVPSTVTVLQGATTATFTVQSAPVAATTAVTITAASGGATAQATLTVTAVKLSSITLSPTSVVGGLSSTGTVTLMGSAAVDTVVGLSSSNQTVATVPPSVTVPAGSTGASFVVETSPVTSASTSIIAATAGGATKQAAQTVTPARLAALTLSPTSVLDGSLSQGTVTLTGPARPGGITVTLSSSNAATAHVPASVSVAAGSKSATFPITTAAVSSRTTVTISAACSGKTVTARLTVTRVAKSVSALSLNPTIVYGVGTSTATVTLDAVAPPGGFLGTLASANTAVATVQATFVVPAGTRTTTFIVTTKAVTKSTTVAISATGGGVKKSANLSVRP